MAKASCHTCVYACWDLGNALRNFSSGFPNQPMCANQPEAPGLMRATPVGNACRNYRPKPPTPEGDVKRIPLAGGAYAYVDAADYEWLSQYSWHVYAGGYAARVEKGKLVYMHREIMKPPEGMVVDHIDGNKGNNCRFNLRVCTPTENRRNSAKHAQRSSRFKGVGYIARRDKYWAKLWFNGKDHWLGYFDEEVEAARAYDYKAVECSGPFARVNLPEEWPPERVQQVYAEARAQRETVAAEAALAKARKGKGKEASVERKDAQRRTAGEKKVRKSGSEKAGRRRRKRAAPHTTKQSEKKNRKSGAKPTIHPARRVSPGRRTRTAKRKTKAAPAVVTP